MKKLFSVIAIFLIMAFKASADDKGSSTVWYMGTYLNSSDHGSTCVIYCNPSSLYCYSITTSNVQQNQSILDITPTAIEQSNNTPWITLGDAGAQNGTFVTIQTYDESQNITNTYTGYYSGMQFSYNADGSITSTIILQGN